MRAVILLVVAGCGRISFGGGSDGAGSDGAGSDGAGQSSVTLVTSVEIHAPATTALVTEPIAITPGAALVAGISCHYCANLGSITSITGGGVTWQQVVAGPAGGIGGAEVVWLYAGFDASGGTDTIAMTMVQDDWQLEVGEWTGLSGTIDSSGKLYTPNGTTAVAPTLATAHSDELVVIAETGFPGDAPVGAPDHDSVFLPYVATVNQPLVVAYQVAATPNTYTTTWPISASPVYVVAAAFQSQ